MSPLVISDVFENVPCSKRIYRVSALCACEMSVPMQVVYYDENHLKAEAFA